MTIDDRTIKKKENNKYGGDVGDRLRCIGTTIYHGRERGWGHNFTKGNNVEKEEKTPDTFSVVATRRVARSSLGPSLSATKPP